MNMGRLPLSASHTPSAAYFRNVASVFQGCSVAVRRGCAVGLLCATACFAQALHPPAAPPDSGASVKTVHRTRTNSTAERKRAARSSPKKAPSIPADAEAQPATVTLQNGALTIEAHNSDLGGILKKIAELSGMTIDGLSNNARVFGAYGPGNPRDVLSHLLVGTGYSFFMAGNGRDGAPRELVLIAQSGNVPVPATTMPATQQQAAPAPPPHTTAQDPLDENSGDEDSSQDPSNRDQRMQQLLQRLGDIQDQQQNSHQ